MILPLDYFAKPAETQFQRFLVFLAAGCYQKKKKNRGGKSNLTQQISIRFPGTSMFFFFEKKMLMFNPWAGNLERRSSRSQRASGKGHTDSRQYKQAVAHYPKRRGSLRTTCINHQCCQITTTDKQSLLINNQCRGFHSFGCTEICGITPGPFFFFFFFLKKGLVRENHGSKY